MTSAHSHSSEFPEMVPLAKKPLVYEAALHTLDTWITPTNRFFIRTHFNIAELDQSDWRLVVDGEVARSLTLSYDTFRQLPAKDLTVLLECAGNSRAAVQPTIAGALFQHGAVGTAQWTGVPLRVVLERAGLKPTAREVVFESCDAGEDERGHKDKCYARSLTLDKALHPDTLLAYQMNGETLLPEHGYPVRLIVPGWYGMASVKWLTHICVVDRPFEGHYQTGYYIFVKEGPEDGAPKERVTSLRVKSLITWPRRGQIVEQGRHRIQGVAWSGTGPVQRVEVSIHAAEWQVAALQPSRSPYAWQRWELEWAATQPGHFLVRARATDVKGNTQPTPEQWEWNYHAFGNNAIQTVPVEVYDPAA